MISEIKIGKFLNNEHISDWSPSIQIEKDILEFIQKINHFEYIFGKNT